MAELLHDYDPPPWVTGDLRARAPRSRVRLGHLPTPLRRWNLLAPGAAATSCDVWIKNDSLSGCEMSGNKVRKLEFLLAHAIRGGYDSVITVGGVQSNHCRATAAACAQLGIKAHCVLRTASEDAAQLDPGLEGNLMVLRLCGATAHLVSDARAKAHPGGAWALVQALSARLAAEGGRPYAFPSGGSNALGIWGYVECVAELQRQLSTCQGGSPTPTPFDTIYFACGSGGTAAGLALGLHLSGASRSAGGPTELVGIGVDDTPDFFYDKIDVLLRELNVVQHIPGEEEALPAARALLRIEDGVGLGYSIASDEELVWIASLARRSGIVLDPAYTGKAALGMKRDLERCLSKGAAAPRRVLFVHTGGLLGIYAKAQQMMGAAFADTDEGGGGGVRGGGVGWEPLRV